MKYVPTLHFSLKETLVLLVLMLESSTIYDHFIRKIPALQSFITQLYVCVDLMLLSVYENKKLQEQ
jgi:hypothetical protein